MKLEGLYAITDPVLTPYGDIERYVSEAIRGGAKILQLRDKELKDEELYPVAMRLKRLCDENGVCFIIDDRVVLAKAVNADGIHIGLEDIDPLDAREIIGSGKIIGVSCYGDLERAKGAIKKGADYVAFGSFFPSPTKPHAKVVDKSVLSEAKSLGVPVCAIGGIGINNGGELVTAGADMLSVISALWVGDIYQNASCFSSFYKNLS